MLVALGILIALVLAVSLLSDVSPSPERALLPMPSTRSALPGGTTICYELLRRLEVDSRRYDAPFASERLDPVGVLVVLSAVVQPDAHERTALTEWVAAGGVLIATSELAAWALGQRWQDPSQRQSGPPPAAARFPRASRAPAADEPFGPLARDVSGAHFATRKTWRARAARGPGTGPAASLFRDALGPRIVETPLGRGGIIVLTDESFLTNGRIGRVDNGILTANLFFYALSRAPAARVVFDEYHLGFGRRPTSWSMMAAFLVTTAPGWAVLALALAGVLLLVHYGRRFGLRRDPVTVRRRAKVEFVRAVGATWAAAAAHRMAADINHRWLKAQAAAAVGLPASASNSDVADRLARRTDGTPERYLRPMNEVEGLLEWARLSQEQARLIFRRLAEAEREVLHARGPGD